MNQKIVFIKGYYRKNKTDPNKMDYIQSYKSKLRKNRNKKITYENFMKFYNLQFDDSKIARNIGCSNTRISEIRKELGLPSYRKWVKLDYNKIRELHAQKLSVPDIIKITGYKKEPVYNALKVMGLTLNPVNKKPEIIDIKILKKLVDEGLNDKEIAQKLGNINPRSVSYKRIKNLNVKRKSFKKLDYEKIRELNLKGLNDKKISEYLGYLYSSVSYARRSMDLKNNNFFGHKEPYKKRKIDNTKLIELYNNGLFDKEIGKIIGISHHMVRYWRQKLGLKTKHPTGKNKKINYLKIYKLYRKGYNDTKISNEVKCSNTVIYRWRKRNNFPINKLENINYDKILKFYYENRDNNSMVEISKKWYNRKKIKKYEITKFIENIGFALMEECKKNPDCPFKPLISNEEMKKNA